jgi:hypothetical protein
VVWAELRHAALARFFFSVCSLVDDQRSIHERFFFLLSAFTSHSKALHLIFALPLYIGARSGSQVGMRL